MKDNSSKKEKLELTDSQKKMLEQVGKQVSKTLSGLQGPLSQIKKTLSNIKPIIKSDDQVILENYIPTEARILNALEDIRDQNKSRKYDSGDFVYNSNEKTITRYSGSKQYTYQFPSANKNFRLINFLLRKKDFIETVRIQEYLKSDTVESVRTKIGELNKSLSDKLKMKNINFIEANPPMGYAINRDLHITIED